MRGKCVAGALLIVSGYSHADDQKIVESFRVLANECSAIYAASAEPVVHNKGSDGKWRKVVRDDSDVRFDVTRTDSLVSPFGGVIVAQSVIWISAPQLTREDAEAVSTLTKTIKSLDEIRFVYRQGHWVSTGRVSTIDLFNKDGQLEGRPSTIKFQGADATKGDVPAAQCILLAKTNS